MLHSTTSSGILIVATPFYAVLAGEAGRLTLLPGRLALTYKAILVAVVDRML